VNSAGAQHGAKGTGELAITIMQGKTDWKQSAIDLVDGLASHSDDEFGDLSANRGPSWTGGCLDPSNLRAIS